MNETLHGIDSMLHTIERHFEMHRGRVITSSESIVMAGVYTFAIEEYGKLLMLSRLTPMASRVRIPYATGFRNHLEKFNAAIADLPPECTSLAGAFDPELFDPQIFSTGVITDFEARQAIFYSDIDETGNGVIGTPQIEMDRLVAAAHSLRNRVLGFRIP